MRASAGAELRPQVQAVQDAVDQVQTAVADIASGGVAPAVTRGGRPGDRVEDAARFAAGRCVCRSDHTDHLTLDTPQPGDEADHVHLVMDQPVESASGPVRCDWWRAGERCRWTGRCPGDDVC